MDGTREKTAGRGPGGAIALLVLALVFLPARPASAQLCENPAGPFIVASVAITTTATAIQLAYGPPDGALPLLLSFATDMTQDLLLSDRAVVNFSITDALGDIPLIGNIIGDAIPFDGDLTHIGGLGYMDITMRARLDKFWVDLLGGLRSMVAQFYASDVNTARLLTSVDDASGMAAGAIKHQQDEIESKLQHMVPGAACQFDTVALNAAPAAAVRTAVAGAFTQQVSDFAGNQVGSAAEMGGNSLRQVRYNLYRAKFCDPDSNGGAAPCLEDTGSESNEGNVAPGGGAPSTAPQPLANAAAATGKTVFSKDTINLANPDRRIAIREMVLNILNFEAPNPIPAGALASSAGQQLMQRNRSYLTQMDALSGLITSVIGERAPVPESDAASQVQQMRLKVGAASASATPGERETRQAVVEQILDPNYYVKLGESGGTIAQKEVYLKAYNATMLFKLIEKQEMISNAYAIETANLLRVYRGEFNSPAEQNPF